MTEPLHVLIVDDDQDMIDLIRTLLEFAGHQVTTAGDAEAALSELETLRPDVILLDVLMPGINGFELCERLRANPDFEQVRIIFVSQKHYSYDQKRARNIGADGFISKPIDQSRFLSQVERIVEDRFELSFWGVRGTLPVTGESSLRYGGDTSCVSIEFPGGELFVFDAGTGIKRLSDSIKARAAGRIDAKIFISHPHWDHINFLPFFDPLFIQGNSFEVMGPAQGSVSMEDQVHQQMDGVYFPITPVEFAASIRYRNLAEETLKFGEISVQTMFLNHPGACLGYRVTYRGRSVCYITDNELYPEDNPLHNDVYVARLAEFVRATDVLIIDSTYTDEEYLTHMDWGHSPISEVVRLADRAAVKTLCLYHHDPDQDDLAIDEKLKEARRQLQETGSATECHAPAVGSNLRL